MTLRLGLRFQELQNLLDNLEEISEEYIPNFETTCMDDQIISMGHGFGGVSAL